jgi:hypothetical protein
MPEADKSARTQYRHWVSFASGEPPFALVLPDRRLFDTFASWVGGTGGPQGYSFPHEGQDTCINFAHVQRMEVEEVTEGSDSPRGGLGNPVPLKEPPPLE